jgi:soluble lytic murein transglycosylase
LQEQGRGDLARVELAALTARFPADYYAYQAARRLGPRPWPYAEGYLASPAEAAVVVEIRDLARAGMLRQARRLLAETSEDAVGELGPSDLATLARVAEQTRQPTLAARLQRLRSLRFPDGSGAARRTLQRELASGHVALLSQHAELQRIDPALVLALVREESGFNPVAVSPVGALGLMQLMPATARQLLAEDGRRDATRAAILEPENNVAIGVRYFARMLRAFGRQAEYALAAYSAGPGAVTRWREARSDLPTDIFVEEIPYAETRRYVKRVLGWRQTLAVALDVQPDSDSLLTAAEP